MAALTSRVASRLMKVVASAVLQGVEEPKLWSRMTERTELLPPYGLNGSNKTGENSGHCHRRRDDERPAAACHARRLLVLVAVSRVCSA